MSRNRAAVFQSPRLYALPPLPPPEAKKIVTPPPEARRPAPHARRTPAWVHVREREIVVEAQDEDALELVDRALIAALLQAGIGAEKEGVRLAAAVSPPICYGKIRVSGIGGNEIARARLAAARTAAANVLLDGGCELAR